MIWRCPSCHGPLETVADAVRCTGCRETFSVIAGIPDLRFPKPTDDDSLHDIAEARAVAATADSKTPDQLVSAFFSRREGFDGWSAHDTELRVRQSLGLPLRLRAEVDGWLRPVTSATNFLDVGCGLGGLLSAAATTGRQGIGIDNRMIVLVVAKRLIETSGGTAELACATAEALPLADASIGGVVMYDVVEHIRNLEKALSEVSRVTRLGGAIACSTPNRFSLAPEPHVHLWGVGWLPRKYQAAYVKKRSGWDYNGTMLLTPRELLRLIKSSTQFAAQIKLPAIPDAEVTAARGPRRLLARVYNVAARQRLLRGALLAVGPFFQITGVKAPAA